MTTRHREIIELSDGDRAIDLTLSVLFDVNGDGQIEFPDVELIRGCVWFGDYALDIDCASGGPHSDAEIEDWIETKYADDILEAIRDLREARKYDHE